MADWVQVAIRGEIEDQHCKVVDIDDTDVAVYNLGGEYFAIEDVCTHDGGGISDGEVAGDRAVCPRHFAEFSIRTGEALTPPAYEGVHSFPVRINGEAIELCDDRD